MWCKTGQEKLQKMFVKSVLLLFKCQCMHQIERCRAEQSHTSIHEVQLTAVGSDARLSTCVFEGLLKLRFLSLECTASGP